VRDSLTSLGERSILGSVRIRGHIDPAPETQQCSFLVETLDVEA
jgi:hypothetical protein